MARHICRLQHPTGRVLLIRSSVESARHWVVDRNRLAAIIDCRKAVWVSDSRWEPTDFVLVSHVLECLALAHPSVN
jgi:hypothetical protein